MDRNYKSLELNQDCQVYGTIKRSCVQTPERLPDRPEPVYSVVIAIDGNLAHTLGLLYGQCLGPHVTNLQELEDRFMNATELPFDSIIKPCVSGVGDSGEFDYGTPVQVSCRFEVIDGELSADGSGQFKFPRLVLRFVDAEWDDTPKPEPLPEPDPETLKFYDF